MPTITAGSQQTITLTADQSAQVSTLGLAYVDLVAGAPGSPYDSRRINAGVPQNFGPYGVPAVLRVRAVQLAANYDFLSRAPGAVSAAGSQLVDAATAGYSTGWLTGWPFAERFGFQPTGVSGTASLTIDGSLDGVTATETLGVVTLLPADNGKQFYTPPLSVGYPFIRIAVVADGGGTHAIGRGV